jgi:hypothetical protein
MLARIIGGFGITEDVEETEIINLIEVENPQIQSQNKKKSSFNTFRGKTIRSTGNQKYSTKEISFENLVECFNKNILIIPEFQRAVSKDKIAKMKKSYLDDSEIFNYLTNPLQIASLKNMSDPAITSELYFLIDGQHRFFTYKELYEQNSIDGHIYVNFITCETPEQIHKFYMSFNVDNPDVYFDINEIIGYQNYVKYQEFSKGINKLYKKYFKTDDSAIYSLDSFVKQCEKYEYLDYFEKIDDAITYLNSKNRSYWIEYYSNEPIEKFNYNKKVQEFIKDKKIFSIKANNFLEWLMCEDQNVPQFKFNHVIKKSSSSSKKTLKIASCV